MQEKNPDSKSGSISDGDSSTVIANFSVGETGSNSSDLSHIDGNLADVSL